MRAASGPRWTRPPRPVSSRPARVLDPGPRRSSRRARSRRRRRRRWAPSARRPASETTSKPRGDPAVGQVTHKAAAQTPGSGDAALAGAAPAPHHRRPAWPPQLEAEVRPHARRPVLGVACTRPSPRPRRPRRSEGAAPRRRPCRRCPAAATLGLPGRGARRGVPAAAAAAASRRRARAAGRAGTAGAAAAAAAGAEPLRR